VPPAVVPAAWLGACLGQEACIAHVLRISTRYRRLAQLEEGYGVNLQPLESLVRAVYKDDPASCFPLKNSGLREKETVARTNAKRRLYTYQPINTVLRRIDALQRRLLEEGMDAFDPGFEAKRGALIGQLVYEAAMAADEKDIPLLRKADLVPRMVPFLNYLKESGQLRIARDGTFLSLPGMERQLPPPAPAGACRPR
jgi:hypothetical protein